VSSVEDRNRGEVETRSEAQSPEGKSACNSAANPDFSTPFAALTTVEMTSFLQSNIKEQKDEMGIVGSKPYVGVSFYFAG